MNITDIRPKIPADVRAAIRAFLNACQKEAKPFAMEEAMGAVRSIFPDLAIPDVDLLDAISSEAYAAGFDVGGGSGPASKTHKRKALERWDNEGGAIGRSPRIEAQRRTDNDTNGARRRTKETKDRNELH